MLKILILYLLSFAAACETDFECSWDLNCDGKCIGGNCTYPTILNCRDSLYTPYCSRGQSKCMECRQNSDCPGNRPFCNEGKCLQCLYNSHCRRNETCSSACVDSTCVSSLTSSICNINQTCYQENGICEISCKLQKCPNNMHCNPTDGKCYICLNRTHCKTESSETCGSECLSDINYNTYCSSTQPCNSYQDCLLLPRRKSYSCVTTRNYTSNLSKTNPSYLYILLIFFYFL